MTIEIGETLPETTLKMMGESGIEDVNTKELFAGKKTVLFATPGAFTPTCAQKHLPDYVNNADEIYQKGVDQIVCLSVNDPFVMKHWGKISGAEGKIQMLSDWNAEFVTSIGLDMDAQALGLGKRAKRFMMIIEDNVLKKLEVEENPGELDRAAAGICLAKL
jgi:peroxiredoxin